MGAHSFETYACGKTAGEAYKKAVDTALYESGHDSYNGTISTTGSFQELSLPANIKPMDFVRLVWDRDCLPYQEDAQGNEIAQTFVKPPIRRKFKDDQDKRNHEYEKETWARWMKMPPEVQAQIMRCHPQKWEACYVIEAKGAAARKDAWVKPKRGEKVYLFFGLAAS